MTDEEIEEFSGMLKKDARKHADTIMDIRRKITDTEDFEELTGLSQDEYELLVQILGKEIEQMEQIASNSKNFLKNLYD